MKTAQSAQASIDKLPLRKPVRVTEILDDDGVTPRLRFECENPDGLGTKRMEIDKPPTPAQCDDLARNLPLHKEHREAARLALRKDA